MAPGSSPSVSAWLHDAQLVGALGRHVEQLGDHLERHREGELVDELDRSALGGAIEHVVDHRLDPRPQAVDRRSA